jgi:hypothetical protein
VSGDVSELVLDTLVEWGLASVIYDKYAGIVVKYNHSSPLLGSLIAAKALGIVPDALQYFEKGGSALISAALISEEFRDDLIGFSKFLLSEKGRSDANIVPASDRVVLLNDNQVQDFDINAAQLQEAVRQSNSDLGGSENRSRFIAQISAARELVRGKCVRVFLLYETLIKILHTLIEKYKDEAIGKLASRLLDLVLDQIMGK